MQHRHTPFSLTSLCALSIHQKRAFLRFRFPLFFSLPSLFFCKTFVVYFYCCLVEMFFTPFIPIWHSRRVKSAVSVFWRPRVVRRVEARWRRFTPSTQYSLAKSTYPNASIFIFGAFLSLSLSLSLHRACSLQSCFYPAAPHAHTQGICLFTLFKTSLSICALSPATHRECTLSPPTKEQTQSSFQKKKQKKECTPRCGLPS